MLGEKRFWVKITVNIFNNYDDYQTIFLKCLYLFSSIVLNSKLVEALFLLFLDTKKLKSHIVVKLIDSSLDSEFKTVIDMYK